MFGKRDRQLPRPRRWRGRSGSGAGARAVCGRHAGPVASAPPAARGRTLSEVTLGTPLPPAIADRSPPGDDRPVRLRCGPCSAPDSPSLARRAPAGNVGGFRAHPWFRRGCADPRLPNPVRCGPAKGLSPGCYRPLLGETCRKKRPISSRMPTPCCQALTGSPQISTRRARGRAGQRRRPHPRVAGRRAFGFWWKLEGGL